MSELLIIRAWIEEQLALCEKATAGPWLARDDQDFYQAGRYLGTGPEKYVPDETRDGNKLVPCSIEEVEYFQQDVCRIEGGDDDEAFIAAARTGYPIALKAYLALLEAKP